ncbi:MAG: hypothetical protein GX601_08030, partial [Anaerolineales bacterium]|nr:hypothetical protein [Anaerolineales bacterium]
MNWRLQGANASAGRALRPRARAARISAVVLAMVALLAVGAVDRERRLASTSRPYDSYPQLALDGVNRVLVVAPHCDDEVLSAGGLIQGALERGASVRVAIVTAGDGYPRATQFEYRRAALGPRHFIGMADVRQRESLEGLARLGLSDDRVTFLTYPEQGLSALWWDYWGSGSPYRSGFSGMDVNEYPRAYHSGAPYSGEALLADLRELLQMEQPDLVIGPHPNDEHADHRALSIFTALAVELEQASNAQFRPRVLGYLVHYGLFPQPYGRSPRRALLPPRQLDAVGEWLVYPLSSQMVATKQEALEAYRSQLRITDYYLEAFVRRNELFAEMDQVVALGLVGGEAVTDDDDAVVAVEENG